MKRFSPITHISFTLSCLLATLLLLAIGIGLIPNRTESELEKRATICENLAIQFCGVPHDNIIATFEALTPHIVERNKDIRSMAFRGVDGQLVSATEGHQDMWQKLPENESTPNQIQIPIFKDEKSFGTIEIAFTDIYTIPVFSYLKMNHYLLVLFVAGISYVVFRFYLGRVLRYLDPSSVIPGRVKSVLDNLTESIVVLDANEQIVFANNAFCTTTDQQENTVIGKKLSVFPWVNPGNVKNDAEFPWLEAIQQGRAFTNIPLTLGAKHGKQRMSLVNAMPILGHDGGYRGILTSFTDVTELEEKNKELIDASRSAGMAEVATSVLHNIGNMLNSVNISANQIEKIMRESKLTKIQEIASIMAEHSDNLETFLTEDQRGQRIPGYIIKTVGILSQERENAIQQVELLRNNIDHIIEVIRTQQSYAKIRSFKTSVSVHELIEDAVQINSTILSRSDIHIVREFGDVDYAMIDRQSVLQIIVNLIKNAGDALEKSKVKDKRIVVRCEKSDSNHLNISVEDNGIGIPPENLTKIFKHGFTTKDKGHGFGLHGSALNAKQMGGTLQVRSDGPGKGAAFILSLPLDTGTHKDGTREKQILQPSNPDH